MNNVCFGHDRLFRSSMTDLRVAREFFERHLPKNIKKQVDLGVLKMTHETYIDKTLKMHQSDVLYQTRLSNKTAFLYLLCEHQSKPEMMMPFRLLKYSINIWDNYLKQQKSSKNKLPLIVAMVFYNGSEPYTYSMDFKDLLDAPREMIDEIWGAPFRLINVQEIADSELQQYQWSGILEFFMKHAYARDFLIPLRKVIDRLAALDKEGHGDYVLSLLHYALNVTRMTNLNDFTETVQNHLTHVTGEKIMTLADILIERGREQGIEQGIERGEHSLFLRLLKRKFRKIPSKYMSCIDKANEKTLLKWSDHLFEANTLAEIFGE